MAWNGSDRIGKERKPAKRAKPSVLRGIVAALLVTCGAAVVLWFFLCEDRESYNPIHDVTRSARIAEINPALAANTDKQESATEETKIDPNARPTKVGEIINGYVMLPSGRIHKRQGVVTNAVEDRAKAPYAIFEHPCENEIACLLSLKPGDMLLGVPHYNGKFTEAFLQSLENPIIVTEDDTPEQARLKNAVIDAKLQLKIALDNGEDIEALMLEARAELQDLMRYKMEVRELFNEARLNECETDEDVGILLDACNKMLESKGIAPMSFGPITRRNLLFHSDE